MSRTPKVRVNNPGLLAWARESAGYQVEDVAARLDKSPSDIRAWEEGEDAPTYRQLQAFAKMVRRPVAALFLPEVPPAAPPPEDFRTLPGAHLPPLGPQALLAFRELRNSVAELRTLLDELRQPLALKVPTWPSTDESPPPRAAALRELLGVTVEDQMACRHGTQAFDMWRDVLFDSGVLVQVFGVPVAEVRGFSVLADDLGGIGVSSQDSSGAKIFSVFHEVGHLCLRRPGVSAYLSRRAGRRDARALETYCDAFAAAFLLPLDHPAVADALHELESDFRLETAQALARRFCVSKYVLARRLLDAERIGPQRFWDSYRSWRAHDDEVAATRRGRRQDAEGGPSSVVVRVSHAGKRYVATVMEALHQGVLSRHEAARVLALRADNLADAQAMAFGG
jgi:Zn-dependent peptidase ImmA (M78 family)/transcriptional regulator with XRE-family HTH domain